MFGLLGVLVRILLRVLLRQGLEYAFTSDRPRINPAVVQGLGLIVAGGVVGGGSALLLWPIIFSSTIYLIFDGLVVSALVGGGIIRLAIGLFTVSDNVEARSGPAMSPVNYYVALPEEMPPGYCWQCGRRVKPDSLICLRCGATQPKGAQQRTMMSAPTFERGGDSGLWPQWQPEEDPEEDPLRRLGPVPMGPGQYPGGGPYPPPGPGVPFPGGVPYPPYPPYPPFPPQNMPPRGPGGPAFPLPSRPMKRPPSGGQFPDGPYPPQQQRPPRGRPPRGLPPQGMPPRERPPRERQPREKKPSRPRWGR